MDPQIWYLVNSRLLKVEAASGFVVQQFWPGDQIWNYKSYNGTVEDIKHQIHQANLSAYAIQLKTPHTLAQNEHKVESTLLKIVSNQLNSINFILYSTEHCLFIYNALLNKTTYLCVAEFKFNTYCIHRSQNFLTCSSCSYST